MPTVSPAVRDRVRRFHRRFGNEALRQRLSVSDPVSYERLPPGDSQRLLRALEVLESSGRPLSAWQQENPAEPAPYRFLTVSLMPDRERLYTAINRRFLSMLEQGALDEVAALLRKGYPGDCPIMKASLLHSQRRYDEAAEVYREMLAQDPGQDIAANNLAALIADAYPEDQEQLAEALALAERFQASDNPYYLDTLGWVLYRTGDLNQAAIFLERAEQLAAGVPTFLYHLAHVRVAQGQAEAARDLLRQVLEDEQPFPERAQAQVLLDNLSSTN